MSRVRWVRAAEFLTRAVDGSERPFNRLPVDVTFRTSCEWFRSNVAFERMQLGTLREKLEAYVLGALAAAEKKGKVSRLAVSWSGPYWGRVHDLTWDATTSGGELGCERSESLAVSVEPKKALVALLKRKPLLEGFFIDGGANALADEHETPPGEYGLWIMALVDDAIDTTTRELAVALRRKRIAFTFGGHDGDGPEPWSHYFDRIPEARRESACVPTHEFLAAMLRLLTDDEQAVTTWLGRAKRIRSPKPVAWTSYFLTKILPNAPPERRQIDISEDDKYVVEVKIVRGSVETLSHHKLRTLVAARARADALVRERRSQGFVGSADQRLWQLEEFRAIETALPLRACFSMEHAGRQLDATAAILRWATSGDRDKVRLAFALMPECDGLEGAARDAWEKVNEPEVREQTIDEPLILSASASASVGRLLAEVREASLDGAADGVIAWSYRLRIKVAGRALAPKHVAWRLVKRSPSRAD